MQWSKAIGALSVLAVGVWSVGAIVSLVITGLSGQYRAPAVVVVVLVGVAVLALTAVGAKGRRWLSNSDDYYW